MKENTPTYLKTHRLHDRVMQFALRSEANELRERAGTSKSGRAAKTLVKEGPFRITILALTKGTVLQSHDVTGPVSIQTIRGRLRVTTETVDADLTAGGLVALDAGVTHSVKALSDCAALLTMAVG